MPPITKIFITTSDLTIEPSYKFKYNSLKLLNNKTVAAQVLKKIGPNQFQFLINGNKINARSRIPLNEGENLKLHIYEKDNQFVLKVVDTPTSLKLLSSSGQLHGLGKAGPYQHILDFINQINDKNIDSLTPNLSKDIKSLSQLIEKMALKSTDAKMTYLKDLIEHSGLIMEKKIGSVLKSSIKLSTPPGQSEMNQFAQNDLKGLTLKILDKLPRVLEGEGKILSNFQDGLEKLQQLNQNAFQESGKFLLPLPVFFQGKINFGQLLIDLGKDNKDVKNANKRIIRVAFILELTELGNILGDFSFLNKALNGFFGVCHETTQKDFEQEIPVVVQNLQEKGFTVQSLECKLLPTKALLNMSLVEQMSLEHEGTLNLII